MANTSLITKEINLFVYDTRENFEKTKSFIGITLFKNVISVQNLAELKYELEKLNDNDKIFLAVHVFATMDIKGIKEFITSGIQSEYPSLPYCFVTEKSGKETEIQILNNDITYRKVIKYHQISSGLNEGAQFAATKSQISQNLKSINVSNSKHLSVYNYGIITALFKDEFEELKKVFDFPDTETETVGKKVFRIGYLRSNRDIKVIAAVLNATGLVDSSIVATLMLETFKPQYLLMSGVCGGAKKYKFGDIILAKQIFAFQKGKIVDHPAVLAAIENEDDQPFLFDTNKHPVDHKHLYDADGNQVFISIEQFEVEHDAMITLDITVEDKLIHKLTDICNKINLQLQEDGRFIKDINADVKIEIEPMASGTMVINKKGYFDEVIKKINRNVAAVEMESYGVARACSMANGGRTIPIIFKSVMDHTFKKNDTQNGIDVKKLAAYTSAQFMKFLFEEKII